MQEDCGFGRGREAGANDDAASGGIAVDAVFKNFFVVEADAQFFFGGPFEAGEQFISAIGRGVGESGQRFPGCILLRKNPCGFESREAFDGGTVVVIGFGFLAVDAGGEDGDAFGAFDDVSP